MPQDFSGLDRETLGRLVRDEWMKWARETDQKKPDWLLTWDDMKEAHREADRRLGERVMRHVMAHMTRIQNAVVEVQRPNIGDRVVDREYPDRRGTMEDGPTSWTEYRMDGTSNAGIVRTFARVRWDDGRFDWVNLFLLVKIAPETPALPPTSDVIHVKGEVIDG